MALLENRTAVITGGAQGIGLAVAERFVAEGARVVLADLDGAAAEAKALELGPDVATGIACDVVNGEDVERALETAVATYGSLDIVVNNAGITRDATMRKMTEDQFDQVIAVHLKGCWHGTRLPPPGCASRSRRDREHLLDLRQGRHGRADQLLAPRRPASSGSPRPRPRRWPTTGSGSTRSSPA